MNQRLRRIAQLAILAALGLALAGCEKHSVDCTDDSATTTTIGIVRDALESATAKAMQNDESSSSAPLSKIRAAIAQLVISIDDVRTTKKDPDSTKRFCTGTLKVRFPAAALDDAEKARAAAGLNTVSDLADADDVTRSADAFTSDIDYNVQPTDDGSASMPRPTTATRCSGSLRKCSRRGCCVMPSKMQARRAASGRPTECRAAGSTRCAAPGRSRRS